MSKKVESIKELTRICSKPTKENWYGRVYLRKVAMYFVKLLLHTSITANQTSILVIFIGLVAGIFLTIGNYWYTLIGVLLLQLWYIFDHVDGAIARYRNEVSILGEYLEQVNHVIMIPFIFVCISFGVYNIFHDPKIFILGFSSSFVLLSSLSLSFMRLILLHDVKKEVITLKDKSINEQIYVNKKSFLKTPLTNSVYFKVINNFLFRAYIVIDIILFAAIFDIMYLLLLAYGILLPCFFIVSQVYYYTKGDIS